MTTVYRPITLLESARKAMDPWNNNHSLDEVRALVLITICLNEMNLKSAASNWLGNAVQVGQGLGLYSESGQWSVIDAEIRRRTWWVIYILDRTMAIDLDQPFLIDDTYCDVSLPTAVDDQYLREDSMPEGAWPLTNSLLTVIHVVRSYTPLVKALEEPTLSAAQLSTFDGHFKRSLSAFHPTCEPSSTAALSPHSLAPLAYVLHGRLLLYGHNLSLNCSSEVRLAAVENCTHVAVDTVSYISRTKSPTKGATALLTEHILCSTFFLLLSGYLDHANACIKALAGISSQRDVTACGRLLACFISALSAKRTKIANHLSQRFPTYQSAILMSFAQDEELLAYVHVALQGSYHGNVPWLGRSCKDRDCPPAKPDTASQGHHRANGNGLLGSEQIIHQNKECRDWLGWARLESMAWNLASTYSPWPPPQPLRAKIEFINDHELSQSF